MAATITVNSAKGYISGSNNWTVTYSKKATNQYLLSDTLYANGYLGFLFQSDKPLTALKLAYAFETAVSGTFKVRVNQSSSPFTEPILISDTTMSASSKTASVTLNDAFAATTNYWVWIIGPANNKNPTVTMTPTAVKYAVTLPSGEGYEAAAVSGYSSPVEHGESFKFTVTLDSGYIKGESFAVEEGGTTLTESDGAYTISNITSNKTVTVAGVVLGGLVWIYDGSSWNAYQPFIYNGSAWEQYMPYVYDNGWHLISGGGGGEQPPAPYTGAVAGMAVAGKAITGTGG